jgi:hypothetical protein
VPASIAVNSAMAVPTIHLLVDEALFDDKAPLDRTV